MRSATPKRPRLQFSLRTLFLAVLVLSLPLGWLGAKFAEARKQRNAVDAILALGGFVDYDTGPPDVPYPGPSWVERLLGVEFVADVERIELCDTTLSEDLIEHIAGMHKLEILYLDRTNLDDAGVAKLGKLTELVWLSMDDTEITDESLKHLSHLENLELLDIKGTAITGEGLRSLPILPNLVSLDLDRTTINDADLHTLKRMPTLIWVGLKDTRVTDEGIEDLRKLLPNVEVIFY